ncbi:MULTISPECIES: helix-turn-helix domain-containing protein [unclassified Halomonas]|uniref:helix-turn-helix domain-containing protein n=1 Tax=unclassified Halomonas TaxID=2609666 RepID=UPI0021E3831D|nr:MULTISPECIES: helix-turn-helix domain-containing protein [unclassified Halomonas]UYG01273.1 helix-turn-helix domain-containing protein [Halomonas sp. GD1P12]WNL40984.1 helix-turn-helix domain-containing protein [Halomonas sp. PAMB 3264]
MNASENTAAAMPLTVTRAEDLGRLIRQTRKRQALTLETLAGLCGVSMRFLSELENGRASCGLGRVLLVLETLGIELSAQPTDIDT